MRNELITVPNRGIKGTSGHLNVGLVCSGALKINKTLFFSSFQNFQKVGIAGSRSDFIKNGIFKISKKKSQSKEKLENI